MNLMKLHCVRLGSTTAIEDGCEWMTDQKQVGELMPLKDPSPNTKTTFPFISFQFIPSF